MKELLNEPLFWMYVLSFFVVFIHSFCSYVNEVNDKEAEHYLEMLFSSFVPLVNLLFGIMILYASICDGFKNLRKKKY